jgi:hypothetical protein
MLGVCPAFLRGPRKERVIMGIAAVAEELPGSDELDELYRLDASEPEPENDDDDEEDDGDEADDEGDGDEEDGEGVEPRGIPHP